MSSGRLREFEELRETPATEGRAASWPLWVLGLACVGFGVLALRPSAPPPREQAAADPLTALAAQQRSAQDAELAKARAEKARQLRTDEVTFPGLLSDGENPTTALAAVPKRAPAPQDALPPSEPLPPPATDRLPVVPLPARSVLAATPVVTRPRDTLTRVAAEKGALSGGELVAAGREGGYQLQVSSFRSPEEADQFALELRGRGHRAYVTAAEVEGRGLWHRVRIGPFASQGEASRYRTEFEGKERVVPFVVQPPKPREASQRAEESPSRRSRVVVGGD